MKSMFAQAKELMGVESKPVTAGHTFVFVWYERAKHRVFMDVGATASAFEINTYLATGVMPTRQKLVGFDGEGVYASRSGKPARVIHLCICGASSMRANV